MRTQCKIIPLLLWVLEGRGGGRVQASAAGSTCLQVDRFTDLLTKAPRNGPRPPTRFLFRVAVHASAQGPQPPHDTPTRHQTGA